MFIGIFLFGRNVLISRYKSDKCAICNYCVATSEIRLSTCRLSFGAALFLCLHIKIKKEGIYMPTPVIIILIVLAVLALLGGILCELVNRISLFLMCLVFIITALVVKDKLTAPFFVDGNLNWLLYVLIFAGVGALFAAPFFIPSIDTHTFSIGNLAIEETDYRAGIGFCGFGAMVGAIISGPCIGKFTDCGLIIFFILPAIIIGVICLIYSIILIVGTAKGW